MPSPIAQNQTTSTRLSAWIAGLTTVLVLLPALINAGIDVYNAWLNIPTSDSERVNTELFRKYFNKPAVTSFPVAIKHATSMIEAKFSIYEEGDIFVEFGNSSQWFPFPREETGKVTAFNIIESSWAQDQANLKGIGSYRQNEQMDNNAIIRQKLYANGVKETQRIDIKTGKITEQDSSQSTTPGAISKEDHPELRLEEMVASQSITPSILTKEALPFKWLQRLQRLLGQDVTAVSAISAIKKEAVVNSSDGFAMPDTQRDLSPYGVIDLEAQKKSSPEITTPASLCLSPLGSCTIVVPIAKGAQCYCYTASGPISGIAQ
jgi:hypothetical protein